jgi:hypothetical protein
MQENIDCGDKVSDHAGLTPSSDKHESRMKNEPAQDVAMEEAMCYSNTDLVPTLLGTQCY